MNERTRTGAQILVDQLRIHGVDIAFGVPGESYLAVLDALYDARERIRFIICRQEGGAAYMADAYGKLTGRPGVCFVTRGPGASNAAVGLHTAFQDSTPLVLFVGQVAREFCEREAFQEIDFRRMYQPLSKWVAQIDDPRRIPEFVARAFTLATSGRPGPVVLALPEDMQYESAAVADAGPYKAVQAHPGAADMALLRESLAAARAPLLLLGGSTWNAQAVADITAFAQANRLPVATSFRCHDHFDNLHPCYAGDMGIGPNPRLAARIDAADLIIAAGPRLGEATTGGYTRPRAPRPVQKLIHIHMGAEELGRVYQADLPINAGMPQFAAAARALAPVDSSAWAEDTAAAHQNYLDYTRPIPHPGPVQLAEIMAHLRVQMPPETILANGAGNFAGWVHRFWNYRQPGTELAPTNGSMGYGVPSAVAAALVHPGRPVLSFSGDGCFLMNGQELATAMQYGAAPIFFVVNNGMYGTIRMHQEREYPTRVSGTELSNPDFAALGAAFGAWSATATTTEEFRDVLAQAKERIGMRLIHVKIDVEQLAASGATVSGLRAKA